MREALGIIEKGKEAETGRFIPGNQIWKLADPAKVGRPRKLRNPKQLWEIACDYFQHCDDNPIATEETYAGTKGAYVKQQLHPVPYTWAGLEVYANTDLEAYKDADERPEYSDVIRVIDAVMTNQKFSGAAAGVFNANIIARDLGLRDRTDITTDDKPIETTPVDYAKLTTETLQALIAASTQGDNR